MLEKVLHLKLIIKCSRANEQFVNMPYGTKLRRIFKMAKAKFERTKPHCNIVLSVTLTTVKQLLQLLSQRHLQQEYQETQQRTLKISIKLQKRENVVSQFLQLTLSTRQRNVTMHTLTAQDMLTT